LPETEAAQAELVAERLRRQVAQSPLAEVSHSATVSIGVATSDESMAGISDLIRAADQALYAAKRSGRNRVMSSITATDAPSLEGDGDCDMTQRREPFEEPAPKAET
jgi:predicted signal transduction protein with EAL and GGDEF domain